MGDISVKEGMALLNEKAQLTIRLLLIFDGNVYACKCDISKLEILYFETGDLLRSIQNGEYSILEENEYHCR